MKLIDLINGLIGVTEVEAEFPDPERFLTKCLEENFDIWGIRRLDATTLRFYCRLPDRKGVRLLAEVCGAETVNEVSKGLPVKIKRSPHRLGFLIGGAVFLLTLLFLSAFVWRVEITGYGDYSELIKTEAVLKKSGLVPGAPRAFQDTSAIRRNLMEDLDFISGATVNLRGSIAEIELESAVKKPDEKETLPSNLIAEEDAQILSLTVRNGIEAVKENEIVKKGQLLVGGVLDSKRIGFRLVHAEAEIKARVTRRLSVFVPYEETVLYPTGKREKKYTFTLFGKTLFEPKTAFKTYERTSKTDVLTFGDDLALPFALTRTFFSETEAVTVKRSRKEALSEAEKRLSEKEALGMKNLEIEGKEIKKVYSRKGVYLEYIYSIITSLGEDREIYNTAG